MPHKDDRHHQQGSINHHPDVDVDTEFDEALARLRKEALMVEQKREQLVRAAAGGL